MKAVCFSAPSQYELVIDGRKVAGSAQKRHGRAFLQHGSIPLEMDINLLGRALRADMDQTAAAALGTIGWLNQWRRGPLDVSDLEQLLADEFSGHLGIEWQHSEPTDAELQAARRLRDEKFGHPDWTLRR
jgi:lipoate-protein ligase A